MARHAPREQAFAAPHAADHAFSLTVAPPERNATSAAGGPAVPRPGGRAPRSRPSGPVRGTAARGRRGRGAARREHTAAPPVRCEDADVTSRPRR
ncbi:hypothetical protein FE391_12065 [Nonomuraea sp. KC401]|nr:hypothetical protein FE391_12065 [Nonomuraea sp. KC401]